MLIAVAAALLAAAVFICRRPQRGLLLLAALTPFNGLLPILAFTVPVWWKEALLMLTLASALFALRNGMPRRLNVPWWPAMAAFAVFGISSAVLTHGELSWIPIKITFIYAVAVVVLWLAPFGDKDRDRLVTIVVAVATINAVWGLVQQFLGVQALLDLGYEYGQEVRTAGDVLRSFGTFNQPFGYGLFLMIAILVGLAVALGDPRRRRNQVILWLMPVLVIGMFASIVRASYLGLIVGLVFLGVLRYRRHLAMGGLALVAVLPAALLVVPRSALATVLDAESFTTRADGWTVTWSLILNRPFGAGLGGAGSAAEKIVTDALQLPEHLATRIDGALRYSIGLPYQPDNYYVKILIELGPLGLWFFLMFFGAAVLATLKAARWADDAADSNLALGVGAVLAAAAVSSFFSTLLEIFPMDYYIWLLLGTVACMPLRSIAISPSTDMLPVAGVPR